MAEDFLRGELVSLADRLVQKYQAALDRGQVPRVLQL